MKNFNIEGEIGISMKYTERYCPALFLNYGSDVRLWSQDDSDAYVEEPYYYHYVIYLSEVSKEPEPEKKIQKNSKMGNNEKNDCLYRCLWLYLHDNLPWKDDYQFKKSLGVKQYDKISTIEIARIEKLLKNVSINITCETMVREHSKLGVKRLTCSDAAAALR